jgi:hypothetical protein
MPRHFSFRKHTVLLVSLSVIFSFFVLKASIRGPGKYSGVVIFDRWDTCLLLSGVYITYISKDVKENLRVYKNEAMQIDASEVIQPTNPGDGSVRRFTVLGPGPESIHDGAIDAVRLEVKSDFVHHRAVTFSIKIENLGQDSVQINTDEIGPTILGPRVYRPFSSAADGGSMAWITRATLLQPMSWSATVHGRSFSAAYSPDSSTILPEHFNLAPRASKRVKVTFALPPGPYEFLVGFGGGVHEGKSIVSNAITFHVEADGTPVLDD